MQNFTLIWVQPWSIRCSNQSTPYIPRYEEDVPSEEHLQQILQPLSETLLSSCPATWRDATFPDLATKFTFLTRAIEGLERDIPSSQLSYLVSVQDVIRYYQTPVQRAKYLELRPQSLPLNVNIVMDSIKKPLDQS